MKDEFKVDVNVLKVIGATIALLLPNLWDVPVHGNVKRTADPMQSFFMMQCVA